MTETKKTKIVLIEDDSFLAGMYATKLNLEGFNVTQANDGLEGLEKVKEVKPDLILLDIILPKMDGFEVLESLKKSPETKDIPVIMLTNLGKKEEVDKGFEMGAQDYLIKAHFVPSEVIKKIKSYLSQE